MGGQEESSYLEPCNRVRRGKCKTGTRPLQRWLAALMNVVDRNPETIVDLMFNFMQFMIQNEYG